MSEETRAWLEHPDNVGVKVYLQGVAAFKTKNGVKTSLGEEATQFAKASRLTIKTGLSPAMTKHVGNIGAQIDGISEATDNIPVDDEKTRQWVSAIREHIKSARESINVLNRLERLNLIPASQQQGNGITM